MVTTVLLSIACTLLLVIAGILLFKKPVHAAAGGPSEVTDGSVRHFVTLFIVFIGTVGVVYLGHIVISSAGADDAKGKSDAVHLVFGSVLPLLASWVGTVIAYYFSRENLTAATRSVTDLAKEITGTQRLEKVSVQSKMIPVDRIVTVVPSPAKTFAEVDALKLTDVLAFLEQRDVQRLPVWDDGKVLKYVVHRSKIAEYLARSVGQANVGSTTMKDLLDDPKIGAMVRRAVCFVRLDDSLAVAKAKMESTENCEDVFVTDTGQPSEPLKGWLPDNEIAKAGRV
jgi:hypothetical protein